MRIFRTYIRILFLSLSLLTSVSLFADGWTPTDAGLIVNFQDGDQFLLSVEIDGTEYFVSHYPGYTGGKFNYTKDESHVLKLIPQDPDATEPSSATIWTIDTAVTRVKNGTNYALGGISYTMWSSNHYSLTTTSNSYTYTGALTDNEKADYLCDVAFVVPTVRATTNMDPNGTLDAMGDLADHKRGTGDQSWAFDGKMGVGFLGMVYREVYMFDIPRTNEPIVYTNAAVVTFNRTSSNKTWNSKTVKPGRAFHAYADPHHKATTRTLFRLYVLNKPFSSCSSYFFGYDTQRRVKYRDGKKGKPMVITDSTDYRTVYTLDHFYGMEPVEGMPYYQTDGMKVPWEDSVYYYVGYNNEYTTSMGTGETKAKSQFTPLDSLRIRGLKDAPKAYSPSRDAYGYMAIDPSTSEDNLGVAFEPAGYFLRTNSNVNVPMVPNEDRTVWTSEQMWTITGEYIKLAIKATLFTKPEFSEDDQGADIQGWSEMEAGKDIPVVGHPEWTAEGRSGWARIYANSTDKNGNMEFVLADATKHIHYNNNGHFGSEIPEQYAVEGETKVTIQDARLLEGYVFHGWAASPNGPVVIFPKDSTTKSPRVGQEIDLEDLPDGLSLTDGVLNLYAKATYTGSINVAFSFVKEDGKRYFLTHPSTATPRFARARHFDDWTNVFQGMSDAGSTDPNYLSSYLMMGQDGVCALCEKEEYVLNPRRETMYGAEDSLVFYEDFQPGDDEYIGLYYEAPNTVLANNTWAGAFISSNGWPTPATPCIESTQISSTHYFGRNGEGEIERRERSNSDAPNIWYNPTANQFDGIADAGTDFMISGVGVVDAHYVVVPDTTEEWINEIVFDYHEDKTTEQQIWSKLIGKQLLAQMKVGDEIIYFHPNRKKILTTANQLRISSDFRLTQNFTYIRDARAEASGAVAAEDKPTMTTTTNDFARIITSGQSSPVDVIYQGAPIDIIDTIRVTLTQGNVSRIKDYYGRWKKKSEDDGLTVSGDTRYRDILVRTKTYHRGPVQTRLVLKAEQEAYHFSPLKDQSQQLNFTLTKQTFRPLYDSENNLVRDDISDENVITTQLALGPGDCRLVGGTTNFTISEATLQHVTLKTVEDNTTVEDHDTLIISKTIRVDAVDYAIEIRIPLTQAALTDNELIWSAVDAASGKRYFIMAGTGSPDTLIYRQYNRSNSTLYKNGTNNVQLIKGSADAANSQEQYITPWIYEYVEGHPDQLTLKIGLTASDTLHFNVSGSSTPGVSTGAPSALTFRFAGTYTNDNANYEELVRLKYGADKWLKFTAANGLTLQNDSASATVFSFGYLLREYNLYNKGTYPSIASAEFTYNSTAGVNIQTRYKAFREYTMLVGNSLTHLCREDQETIATLKNPSGDWRVSYDIRLLHDCRFGCEKDSSKLGITTNETTLTTTVRPSGASPLGTQYAGKYVNIVDTLQVSLVRLDGAPEYGFKNDWSTYKSIEDATVKVPLIRKTYHEMIYDSLVCIVDNDEYDYSFPTSGENETHTFTLGTERRQGTHVLNVDNQAVAHTTTAVIDLTDSMKLNLPAFAEIRLVDEYGNTPSWCEISDTTANTVTVRCTQNGIRSPRSAYLYFAYLVFVKNDKEENEMRFINFRLTVTQPSFFHYANNQKLIHTAGASGDPMMPDGRQKVHENKQILYYYNPAPYNEPDQNVELPVRERGFYGWWRWYREGVDENDYDVSDMDILDSMWVSPPRNVGSFNYPFRIIGDSVKILNPDKGKSGEPDSIKILVTMGRYTVFHYPASDYSKADPPAKSPLVKPPFDEKTVTYVVDLSNYYDNLPLSMKYVNQVDTAVLDTMQNILEPTLSLREIFELHPWTEMAAEMENYKSLRGESYPYSNEKYREDHVVMAPTGNRLLLTTEQRYNYANLAKGNHSESLLGYYMRDDNWDDWDGDKTCQDTMIWCGGWDATCGWYTYDPSSGHYDTCTYTITQDNDFLIVPARSSIPADQDADTVYYCLRARSWKTENPADEESPELGDYMFNICRYMVIYHRPDQYGPKLETKGKALITDEEIEQHYEVLERLNFDYNLPGKDYTVYPHPLDWEDASYGFSYPKSPEIPDNRHHNKFAPNFPGAGEYGLINRIPYSDYWYKMEQHGGAENGYMIYCDGMSSAGQVAALSLSTHLCEGQRMYFSAYVGNPSNQKGKSCPNFTFSVQGSTNGTTWDDLTSYTTGDIEPSNQWSQIYFPIVFNQKEKEYQHFRVRIYNVASSFDGNDFIIDDMCLFATKPALVAYQANTTCSEGANDSINHVILRIDYQGINNASYNDHDAFYTIEKITTEKDTSFIALEDKYLNEKIKKGSLTKPDTIYGTIPLPAANYEPTHPDSIYDNVEELVARFDATMVKDGDSIQQGYVYEEVDNVIRPVMYVIHKAKVTLDNIYIVRMSADFKELANSICAMTDTVDISNRMMLEINGEEKADWEIANLCPNASYEIGIRVNGSLFRDGTSPLEIDGTCTSDWLIYGDTADASSSTRYGHKYSDILKVVTKVLRSDLEQNTNRFATNLSAVDRSVMGTIQTAEEVTLTGGANAYDVLADLVNNGFLTLYRLKMTATLNAGDSIQYVALPIAGTGYDEALKSEVEVCPNPMFIKLKPKAGDIHMVIGGLHRDSTQASAPVVVLANEQTANEEIAIRIDSLISTETLAVLDSIYITSTDDPNFRKGVHSLMLLPDRDYDFAGANPDYYKSGDTILLHPASNANYHMRPGYKYSFVITLQTRTRAKVDENGCRIGSVPFVISVVPDFVRWNPQTAESNQWNNPDNWIGVNQYNQPIHEDAHFAPLPTSSVIIPTLTSGLPYPEIPSSISSADSIQQVGFTYNTCDAIRFMPGAAIGQQQRLNYNYAVVDMDLPYNTWALRSAPVTGMLTGDIYMSNADINGGTSPWEVGEFDANGRNKDTGNASIWLSLYSHSTIHKDNGVNNPDEERECTAAEWTKVTNGLTLSLPAAEGWAVYARTASSANAAVRLPKNDDIYYYYSRDGEKMLDLYEHNLRTKRDEAAGGSGKAGKLTFNPDGDSQSYTLKKEASSKMYVFGNPTMGYIDIWNFIADNTALSNEIEYLNEMGNHSQITYEDAMASTNTIDNLSRYLPPMHAMIIKVASDSRTLDVTLNTSRVVTAPVVTPAPSPAPRRSPGTKLAKGIMTVTAINPVSSRCNSRLLLGQGYHNALRDGEDAILTTINIDNFTMTGTPTTPFNIYALENGFGLCTDLRDSIVNVPISFYMSDLPFEPVTHLWFTGVNNISGSLVLYDALTDTEREIIDGICLDIETPEQSHETRYFIRRRGYKPNSGSDPIATGSEMFDTDGEQAVKIIENGHVLIIRNGHVYTTFGQKLK